MACLRLGAALHLALLLAARAPLVSASAPAPASAADNLTVGAGVGEAAAAVAPPRPEGLVSGGGNVSLMETAAQGSWGSSWYRCGATICARQSICCMSRTLRNWVTGVPTAICCAAETGCRFMFYNKTSGIRTVNKKGFGEPRCFACAWWNLRKRKKDERKTGCEDRCGGSRCCGGNARCAASGGRSLLGASDGEQR